MKYKIRKKTNTEHGFTSIEILVLLSLTIILALGTFIYFRPFSNNADLETNTDEMMNVIRKAQNQSIAAIDNQNYSVHFESDRGVIFQGSVYNPADPSNEINYITNAVEIYDILLNPAPSTSVIFDRTTGTTDNDGNISLRLVDDPSRTRTIHIDTSGSVSIIP